MVASNALAAMGLCVVKAPAAPVVSFVTLEEQPCPLHVTEGTARTSGGSAQLHCPQDDPSAQPRGGDLPAPALSSAFASPLRIAGADAGDHVRAVRTRDDAATTPLYARLSRLLL
jgi:hypothetical protein